MAGSLGRRVEALEKVSVPEGKFFVDGEWLGRAQLIHKVRKEVAARHDARLREAGEC